MGYDKATFRWNVSGTVALQPGTYKITLQTCKWRTLEVTNGDISATSLSRMWRDHLLGTGGVNRMCRISTL